MPGIKTVHLVKNKETGFDSFLLVSTNDSTSVLVPLKPGQFDIGSPEKYHFEREQETKAAFTVAGNKVVQVCKKSIIVLTQGGERVKEWVCPEGTQI